MHSCTNVGRHPHTPATRSDVPALTSKLLTFNNQPTSASSAEKIGLKMPELQYFGHKPGHSQRQKKKQQQDTDIKEDNIMSTTFSKKSLGKTVRKLLKAYQATAPLRGYTGQAKRLSGCRIRVSLVRARV